MSELTLQQVPLFASLSSEETINLTSILRSVAFPANSILCHEGGHGDRLYIILDGRIEIFKTMSDDDERLLSVRGPGDFTGEMSLLDHQGLHTASARTTTPTQLLEMTRADFDDLLHQQPTLAYKIVRELCLRLQDADSAVISELQGKNRQLAQAYQELQAARVEIIEKERLELELQVARKIQGSILPSVLPGLAGFDFGARMVPARAVGGDFFDVIPLDRDNVGITIGDVSDKGVPAAIFMALTRSLLRAEAHPDTPPNQVLSQVNCHLMDMNEAGMFVTVLYGVLNRETHQFAYARAGHEVPYVFDENGVVSQPPRGHGQPLGILPDPDLDMQNIMLTSGSTLLLYTDGTTDVTDEGGIHLGRTRLQNLLRTSLSPSAQAVCDEVIAALTRYQGDTPQNDDITLLAVRALET